MTGSRRPITRLALGVGVALAVAAAPAVPTFAQQGDCEYDPDRMRLICRISAPAAPNRSVPLDPEGRLVWERVRAIGPCPGREEVDPDTGAINLIEGMHWWLRIWNTTTGELVSESTTCQYPGESPPAPPPPPPTEAEWREANEDVLRISTSLNPRADIGGIAGLDVWFWCSNPGIVTVDPLVLRGWTVTATVEPVAFRWRVGGHGATREFASGDCGMEPSTRQGSGAGAAWVWQPQTIGGYIIEFTSVWTGSWTRTYAGVETGTLPLGPIEVAAVPIDYPVDEFVGVLTGE